MAGERRSDERGSMLSEVEALREFWELRLDPLYRGRGMPRGDGRQVLVLPGLFGNDLYLTPIRTWLRRIGYTPRVSTLLINAGCPQRLMEQVERKFAERDTGEGPVAIIGHSRGGMLGKAIAKRLGARCSHFITLGSPVGAMLRAGREGLAAMADPDHKGTAPQAIASSGVVDAGRRAMRLFDPDCDVPACGCSYVEDLLAPLDPATKTWAIYTRDDQVVSPEGCPIDGATNIEVRGTHSGLVFSKKVYPHLAEALSA